MACSFILGIHIYISPKIRILLYSLLSLSSKAKDITSVTASLFLYSLFISCILLLSTITTFNNGFSIFKCLQANSSTSHNSLVSIFSSVVLKEYPKSSKEIAKASDDIKTLFVFLKILIDKDSNYDVVNETDGFFSLLKLCLFGKINFGSEEFDFSQFINEEKGNGIAALFFVTIALLISIEFIETKNFYKCLRNQFDNAPYIYKEIFNKMLEDNEEIEEIQIDRKITYTICRKIPQLIDIIYSDFDFSKQ